MTMLPRVRGDCLPGGAYEARPCPYSTCRHHLGAAAIGVAETCSLDVADRGRHTLEEIAALLRYEPHRMLRDIPASPLEVTRERVRQIEQEALDSVAVRFTQLERAAAAERRRQGWR